jgi:hypothetical protein
MKKGMIKVKSDQHIHLIKGNEYEAEVLENGYVMIQLTKFRIVILANWEYEFC